MEVKAVALEAEALIVAMVVREEALGEAAEEADWLIMVEVEEVVVVSVAVAIQGNPLIQLVHRQILS